MIEVKPGKNLIFSVVEEREGGQGGLEGKYTTSAKKTTPAMIAPEDKDNCLSFNYI